MKINYFVAFMLASIGVWVKTGPNPRYIWRNKFNSVKYRKYSGQYQAYGDYPGNIRACQTFTLKSFKYHKEKGWYIWREQA